jgi:hypothetical protein
LSFQKNVESLGASIKDIDGNAAVKNVAIRIQNMLNKKVEAIEVGHIYCILQVQLFFAEYP